MNNPSPLLPQGSLLEQKNKGRAKVKIAVFFVLAIHGIGLLALLMQGCRKDDGAAAANAATNNVTPEGFQPTNPVIAETSSVALVVPSNTIPVDVIPQPPATPIDYTIVSGDTLGGIATKFHVKLAALTAANPGIEPTKLRPGQKIHIPPPAPATPASTAGATTAVSAPTNGDTIYTVKSGDNLTKIADSFKTTIKAIRAANNLKTDSIKVGQKLTIPAKSSSEPAPAAGGTGAAPVPK